MKKIAEELGVARSTVSRHLKKFGIPIRSNFKVKHRKNLRLGEKIENGVIIKHKQEMRVIESILKMKSEGLSYNAIARVLNQMKVPTKQKGKKWYMETVRQIVLRN